MATAIASTAHSRSAADRVLNAAVAFWFALALIGQWAFFYYLIAFYGPSTLSGHFELWKRAKMLRMSYIAGDHAGNLAFASHALLAAVIAFGGAVQLLPVVRKRAMPVHRWLGRAFFVTAMGLSLSGLFLEWIRGDRENLLSGIAISINALLILWFCYVAWRLARKRQIASHREWALRAYLVANAQWFTRVGFLAYIIATRGFGLGDRWDTPFGKFWDFGCYAVPLAVLELYLHAKRSPAPREKYAMAGGLVILSIAMAAGMIGFSVFVWREVLSKV